MPEEEPVELSEQGYELIEIKEEELSEYVVQIVGEGSPNDD